MAAKKVQGVPYHLWNPSTDMDEFLKYLGVGATMIVRGDGPYVFNQHGKRLINGAGCVWNMAVGHGRAEIVQAAAEQMSELAFSGCWYQANVPALKLAAKLVEITPPQYQRVYLGTSGTRSEETAF